MSRQTITISELGTFRGCKQKWLLRYHLQLDPNRDESAKRYLGTLFHDCTAQGIRAVYDKRPHQGWDICHLAGLDKANGVAAELLIEAQPGEHAPEDMHAEWTEMQDKLYSMIGFYFDFMCERWQYLVPLLVEGEFLAPIRDAKGRAVNLWLTGAIDIVWWDTRTRSIIVEDHKTTSKTFTDFERKAPLDSQMCGYVYATKEVLHTALAAEKRGDIPKGMPSLHALGITESHIESLGTIRYNMSRSRVPSVPHVNQNGKVSVKKIDTTPAIYLEALREQEEVRGIPPDEKQTEKALELKEMDRPYFAQLEHFWSAREVERWRKEAWADARQMRAVSRNPEEATRNQWLCTEGPYGCAYSDGCMDHDQIDAFYTRREKRHAELSLPVVM